MTYMLHIIYIYMYIYVLYIPMLSNAQICHINEIRSKASGSGEAFSPPGRGQRTEQRA